MSAPVPHTENEAKQPSCAGTLLVGDNAIAYLRYITERNSYPMCKQLTREELKIVREACPVRFQPEGTGAVLDLISECTCTPNPSTVFPRLLFFAGPSGHGKNMSCNWMRDVMFGKAPEYDPDYHDKIYLRVDCTQLQANANQLGQSPRQWIAAFSTRAGLSAPASKPDPTTSAYVFVRFVAGLSKYKHGSTSATGIVVFNNYHLASTLVKERLDEILMYQHVVSEQGTPINVKQLIFVLISTQETGPRPANTDKQTETQEKKT
jgi:hypothetical protein